MMSDRLFSDQQSKNIFVSNLNILTKCLSHWFHSVSECEKMASSKLLHWTTMCRFFGRNIYFVSHNFVKY